MFRDLLNFFFLVFFLFDCGIIPVPNENKPKISWICIGRHPRGSWNYEKKKKEVSEIRVGQPFLVLSSSGVMLFKLTFTVNRQSSLKTGSVTNIHICR